MHDAIFPFRPDGRLTERREYLTDIVRSRDDTERRSAVRSKPRRSLRYNTLFEKQDALKLHWFLWELQPYTLLVPQWQRECVVSSVTTASIVVSEPFPADTRVGDEVVLIGVGKEPETNVISAVSGDRLTITLESAPAGTWGAGDTLSPALPCRIPSALNGTRIMPNVMALPLAFEAFPDERDPIEYGAAELTFDGLEVITRRLDWSQSPEANFPWVAEATDAQNGLIATRILGRFPRYTMSARVLCLSREDADFWWGFQERHKGRLGQFLAPLHTDYLPVVPATGAAAVEVSGASLGRYAPSTDAVSHILVERPDETLAVYAVDTITPDFNDDVTRIATLTVWAETFPPEEAKSIQFMMQARMGSDAIEMEWLTAEQARFTLVVTATEKQA